MLKSSIIDTTVRITPSKKLVEYLKTHTKGKSVPTNIQSITKSKGQGETTVVESVRFGEDEVKALQDLNEQMTRTDEKPSGVEDIKDQDSPTKERVLPFLTNSDLRWIFNYLHERRQTDPDVPYLHELLEGSEVILPENHFVERNPVLEERCKKLRKEQEQREYNKMTKNVDNIRKRDPEDTIAYTMRTINSQLIAILQFVFSVAAGFAFGFIGIALIVGDLDFGFRLLLGIMFALIIALAEIYFLAKKLNEDYEVKPEGPIYNDYGQKVPEQTKKEN